MKFEICNGVLFYEVEKNDKEILYTGFKEVAKPILSENEIPFEDIPPASIETIEHDILAILRWEFKCKTKTFPEDRDKSLSAKFIEIKFPHVVKNHIVLKKNMSELFNDLGYYVAQIRNFQDPEDNYLLKTYVQLEPWIPKDDIVGVSNKIISHITSLKNLESIKQFGFIPSSLSQSFDYPNRNFFFITDNLEHILDFYRDWRNDKDTCVILQLDESKLKDYIFCTDGKFYDNNRAVWTYSHIPYDVVIRERRFNYPYYINNEIPTT